MPERHDGVRVLFAARDVDAGAAGVRGVRVGAAVVETERDRPHTREVRRGERTVPRGQPLREVDLVEPFEVQQPEPFSHGAERSPGGDRGRRGPGCYVAVVAGSNRARQRPKAASRIEAAAEERRKAAQRRKTLIAAGIAAAVLLIVVVALVTRGDDKKSTVATGGDTGSVGVATSTVPTATSAAAGSVAGKPCVAVADPLPAGAPEVPVQVGPPPATLVKQDIKEGTGAEVTAASTLTVNYIGVSCSSGKIFDSSYSRGKPATFPLAQVIKGWQDGLPGMKVGGTRLLGIPAAEAYGSSGQPPVIAPDEALWFVVEVVDAT